MGLYFTALHAFGLQYDNHAMLIIVCACVTRVTLNITKEVLLLIIMFKNVYEMIEASSVTMVTSGSFGGGHSPLLDQISPPLGDS